MAESEASQPSVRELLPKAGLPILRTFDDANRSLKYAEIAETLRSSKLSEKLSERELSRLSGRLMHFMETKLGRDVKPEGRPKITKFPCAVFSDFRDDGALYHMLHTALAFAEEQKWDGIDLKKDDRISAHITMVEKIAKVLKRNGFLPSVKVFFSPLISDENVDKLRSILIQHGAHVVQSPEVASHIVYPDPDGTKENEVDAQVLIRYIEKKGDQARVHWWFHPDSYDDWIPVDQVLGKIEEPHEAKEGPWHVQARWVRDLHVFNEWMNELDYEMPTTYDRLLKSPSKIPNGLANKLQVADSDDSPASKGTKTRGSPDSAVPDPPIAKRLKLRSDTEKSKSDDDEENHSSLAAEDDDEVLSQGNGDEDVEMKGSDDETDDTEELSGRKGKFELPPFSAWFDITKIDQIERRACPEFFSEKFESKTPALYKEIRNYMVNTWRAKPRSYLTATAARDKVQGDCGSIMRIHHFLEHWGLINRNVAPDTVPLPILSSPPAPLPTMNLGRGAKVPFVFDDGTEAHISDSRVLTISSNGSPRKRPRTFLRRLFEKPADSEDEDDDDNEDSPNKSTVDYHCDICNMDCSALRYHCATQSDMDLCEVCYTEKKYDTTRMQPRDFIQMKSAGGGIGKQEVDDEVWTESETLLLLEALEMYDDNWSLVAEHVGSKNKDQCVMQFVRLPIEDRFLDNPPGNWRNAVKPGNLAPVEMLKKAGAKEEALGRVTSKTALPAPYSGKPVIYGGDAPSNKLASHALHLSTLTNNKLLAKPLETMVLGCRARDESLLGMYRDFIRDDLEDLEDTQDVEMMDVSTPNGVNRFESGKEGNAKKFEAEQSAEYKITTQDAYEEKKQKMFSAADLAKSDLGELAAEDLLERIREAPELAKLLDKDTDILQDKTAATVAVAAAASRADQLQLLERAEVDRLLTLALDIKLKLINIKMVHLESLKRHEERAKTLMANEANCRFARDMRAHHRYTIRDPAAMPALNGPIGCESTNAGGSNQSRPTPPAIFKPAGNSENVEASKIRTLTKPKEMPRMSPAEYFAHQMRQAELEEQRKEEEKREAERKKREKIEMERAKLERERMERERLELERMERERELERREQERQIAQRIAEANMQQQQFNAILQQPVARVQVAPAIPSAIPNGVARSPAQTGSGRQANGSNHSIPNTPVTSTRSKTRRRAPETPQTSEDNERRRGRGDIDKSRDRGRSKSSRRRRPDVSMDEEEDKVSPVQTKSRNRDRRSTRSNKTGETLQRRDSARSSRKRSTRNSSRTVASTTDMPSIKLRLQLKPVKPCPLRLRIKKPQNGNISDLLGDDDDELLQVVEKRTPRDSTSRGRHANLW